MADRAPVGDVFEALRDRYGLARTGAQDPFRVLVATILSHRTDDDVTYGAANRLFDACPTVEALAEADPSEVAEIVEPVGFYNRKGEGVVRVANRLLDEHDGEVPRDRQALLELPWVGPKTANCVLVYAFGEPVVAVDTHVHRISNRLDWVDTDEPEDTERELEALLNDEQKLAVNEYLVRFGREICKPRAPLCGDCPVVEACPSAEEREPEGVDGVERRTMLGRVADESAPTG
jgi:endonuclease-3